MKYAVMLDCRAGVVRQSFNAWEDVYHVICLQVEDTREAAERIAAEQRTNNPREVRDAWVEERT